MSVYSCTDVTQHDISVRLIISSAVTCRTLVQACSASRLNYCDARHHWQSSTTAAVCPDCRREAGHLRRTMRTYRTFSTRITLAAGATPGRVQGSHTGVQRIKQFGASISRRRLQLNQRRHSPTTFSRLPRVLYRGQGHNTGHRSFAVTGPRDWNSLPAVLRAVEDYEQFKAQLDTFVWLIETAALSDFWF